MDKRLIKLYNETLKNKKIIADLLSKQTNPEDRDARLEILNELMRIQKYFLLAIKDTSNPQELKNMINNLIKLLKVI